MSKYYNFGWETIKKIMQKTGGTCFYCGCVLPEDTDYFDEGGKIVSSKRNWHVDHITPRSKGGSNLIDNLVPACVSCNSQKGTMTADEFTGAVT